MIPLTQRWHTFSLAQQLGHIGSEIARARHWEEKKDAGLSKKALERALELIDLTLDVPCRDSQRREVTLLREVVADWYAQTNVFDVSHEDLEKYCIELTLVSAR